MKRKPTSLSQKQVLLAGGNPQNDIHEDDMNEAQSVKWIQQAASMPGWGKS